LLSFHYFSVGVSGMNTIAGGHPQRELELVHSEVDPVFKTKHATNYGNWTIDLILQFIG
jgi:hypothetical protein